MTTLTDRQQILDTLCILTDDEIRNQTVRSLRETLKLLGVNKINGVYRSHSPKGILVAELLSAIHSRREELTAIANSEIPNPNADNVESADVPIVNLPTPQKLCDRLVEIIRSSTIDNLTSNLKLFGHEVGLLIGQRYPDTIDCKRHQVRTVRQSELINKTHKLIAISHPEYLTYSSAWKQYAAEIRESDKALRDETYRELAETRATQDDNQRIPVSNYESLLDWSKRVLTSVSHLDSTKWKHVAVALAVVSGRRMAEIMSSYCEWKLVDDYSVRYCGLVTKSTESISTLTAPTLLPASLLIEGKQWLVNHGKQSNTLAEVNKRYNKDLSAFVKANRQKALVDDLGLLESSPESREAFSFHSLRKLYGLQLERQYTTNGCNLETAIRKVQNALGHSYSSVTREVYRSEFRLVES